jgi:hypothetical protein
MGEERRMIPYSTLIHINIKGDNPREQYDTICQMKRVLRAIAYPRRGYPEETMQLQEFAEKIQQFCALRDLEIRGGE